MRPNRIRIPLAGIFFEVLFFMTCAVAHEVAVVRSSNVTPYLSAQKALVQEIRTQGHSVTTYLLDDLSDSKLEEVVNQGADAFIAIGTRAAFDLNTRLLPEIKLVFCLVADPHSVGLLNLQRVFGVTTSIPFTRQFELIADTFPKIQTLGIFYRSDKIKGRRRLKELQDALPNEWSLQPIALNEYESHSAALKELFKKNIDIVFTIADREVYNKSMVRTLLKYSLRKKVPVFGFSPSFVRAGAVLGVGVDPKMQGKQAAEILGQLFTKESVSPRIQPSRNFQTAVNLIVSKRLSLDVPDRIVNQAAYVFKK